MTLGGTSSVLGQVDVDDPGSVWNVNGPYGNGSASTLRVGEEGNGALYITNGGVVNVVGAVASAQQASSTSTLAVSNAGSALTISDSLFIGGEVAIPAAQARSSSPTRAAAFRKMS